MKRCPHCKLNKPVTEFSIQRAKPDGRYSICKECYRLYHRVYNKTPQGRRVRYAWSKNWRAKNKDKDRAYNLLKKAIRKGVVTKGPCEVCGISETHGHHDDYSKPLTVKWLCAKHHKLEHASQKETNHAKGK